MFPMGALKKLLTEEPQSLPAEFWPDRDTAMVAPLQETDSGIWPERPKHTCKDGAGGWVITLRISTPSSINPETERKYQDCDACMYDRAKRHSHQILEEAANYTEPLSWMTVSDQTAFKKLTSKWRQRRNRNDTSAAYRAYPQDDGTYIIIHDQPDEPGEPIPTDKTELFDLIYGIAQTPKGQNVSSSVGWGGRYQGNKGDGRAKQDGANPEPVKQIWHTGSITKIAKFTGFELDKNKSATLDIDPREIIRRLEDAQIRYYVSDDKLSLDDFFDEVAKVRGPYRPPLTGGLSAEIIKYENWEPPTNTAGAKGQRKRPAPILLTNSKGVYSVPAN